MVERQHCVMTIDDFINIEWLAPWEPVQPGPESELANEVGPGHPLYQRQALAVGHRNDSDDVLFFLPDHSPPLAVVHLTWAGEQETRSDFPWTTFYFSLDDWVERCMQHDHLHAQ